MTPALLPVDASGYALESPRAEGAGPAGGAAPASEGRPPLESGPPAGGRSDGLDDDGSELREYLLTVQTGGPPCKRARRSPSCPLRRSGPAAAPGGEGPSARVSWSTRALVQSDDAEARAETLPVDELPSASSRLIQSSPRLQPMLPKVGVHTSVLQQLLQRRGAPGGALHPSAEQILALADTAQAVLSQEPTCLKLRAPTKIFGDLHGQYDDLMRLFDAFGYPTREVDGDLSLVDYLFLGDYVDRGRQSLEVVCLLLALKVEHPRHVHLLRGNHECPDVNVSMGFYEECVAKLGLPSGLLVWRRLNVLFEWLPLAAVIEDRLLCVHGGIGRHLHSVAQIEALQRPLGVEAVRDDPVLTDLLWSDPTAHDSIDGVHENHRRGPGVACFGPDRVRAFCAANGLDMIVRAHECVMDGFERFASGHLVTVFSATNYCGVAGNAGALLLVGRDLEVIPKIIQPSVVTPGESDSPTRLDALGGEDECDDGTSAHPHPHRTHGHHLLLAQDDAFTLGEPHTAAAAAAAPYASFSWRGVNVILAGEGAGVADGEEEEEEDIVDGEIGAAEEQPFGAEGEEEEEEEEADGNEGPE